MPDIVFLDTETLGVVTSMELSSHGDLRGLTGSDAFT